MDKCRVTFIPDNKTVVVDRGVTILSAAISAHIHLNAACGGDGVCGKCKVVVRSGQIHAEPSGKISLEERRRGVALACQSLVESDLDVEILPESRLDLSMLSPDELKLRLRGVFAEAEEIFEARPKLGDDIFAYAPLVSKFYLQIQKPNFDDKISDLERITRALEEKIGAKPLSTGLANIRKLGSLLRSCDWKVTAAVMHKGPVAEIVSLEPGDCSQKNFGFAFDIGTTTISAQLIDLNKRSILGTKATYNRQATFGADIISRIIYAQEGDGLEKLHHAVVDVANEMIEAFIEEHSIDLNDVTCLSVAGNTTMIHLLLRIDPSSIRQEPYVAVANLVPVFKASEVGIKINPKGLLFCIPGVSSYVGGDITAGVVACDMHESKDVNLLIDIGTNGEIALGNADWMVSCAASAGPAFEGSGLSCGLRATRGAIEKVSIDAKSLEVEWVTIGNDKPRGICGSGYISLISELLLSGVLDKNGKLNSTIKNKRLRKGEYGNEFVVAFNHESATAEDVIITDADLDNLKRAKAAIYSGIAILVRHMDLDFSQISKIFVAGGFGTSLNIDSSVSIGLLPDVDRKKYVFVGNSSLAGARQSLLSAQASTICDQVAKNITYFELSTDPQYMDEYMAALFFPHTDMARFPSVNYGA